MLGRSGDGWFHGLLGTWEIEFSACVDCISVGDGHFLAYCIAINQVFILITSRWCNCGSGLTVLSCLFTILDFNSRPGPPLRSIQTISGGGRWVLAKLFFSYSTNNSHFSFKM